MKSIWIAKKDILIRLTDRKALLILLLMPLILTMILGLALKNAMDGKVPAMQVGVFVPDTDVQTMEFIDFLQQYQGLSVQQVSQKQDMDTEMATGKMDVGILFPTDWGKQFAQGKAPVMTLLGAPGKSLELAVLQQIISSSIANRVLTTKTIHQLFDIMADEEPQAITNQRFQTQLEERLEEVMREDVSFFNEQSKEEEERVSSMQYYAAAMAAMFLLFNAMYGAKSFHHERQIETFSRLLVTPTSPYAIVAGKVIGTMVFSFAQFGLLMVITHFVLQVDWGTNNLQTLGIAFVYSFAVSGLSLCVATFTSSEKVADFVGAFGVQILALLGGSMLPIYLFPDFMKNIAYFTPNRWALQSFLEAMSGTTWTSLAMSFWVLIGMGLLFTTIGIFRFRQKEG